MLERSLKSLRTVNADDISCCQDSDRDMHCNSWHTHDTGGILNHQALISLNFPDTEPPYEPPHSHTQRQTAMPSEIQMPIFKQSHFHCKHGKSGHSANTFSVPNKFDELFCVFFQKVCDFPSLVMWPSHIIKTFSKWSPRRVGVDYTWTNCSVIAALTLV